MHCLASSLCFWLWTIFRETAEYIQNYPGGDYEDDDGQSVNGIYDQSCIYIVLTLKF